MTEPEKIVWARKGAGKYWLDGHFVDMPSGWQFVPSGDPALTRRVKTLSPDYWVVKRKVGSKEFNVGLCAPAEIVSQITAQLNKERQDPAYQKKLAAGRRRRERIQREYVGDFEDAVLAFLAFHERWHELAVKFAKIVTAFTTPVGSGTVARTGRIPIEERARAAVIAWMRHNTTDYDHRYIAPVAGRRREVRRELAKASLEVLKSYRRGLDAPAGCPLWTALQAQEVKEPPKPAKPVVPLPDAGEFWL